MSSANTKAYVRPAPQKDKNEQAKNIVESFLESILGMGYKKNDIISMIKEELK